MSALKRHVSDILKPFQDKTSPSDCLVFYRPSFGRSGGEQSAEFGEFDAILVSSENIYLIESKWDNLASFKDSKITLRQEQKMRHRIFSWYILHWDVKYSNNWESFVKEQRDDFQKELKERRMAPTGSLLARNLEFILTKLQKHFRKVSSERNIKNVLLFFHNKNTSTPPTKITKGFNLVAIDYSGEIKGNFIPLD